MTRLSSKTYSQNSPGNMLGPSQVFPQKWKYLNRKAFNLTIKVGFLIKKRDTEARELNNILQTSFMGVRKDVFKIFEWLQFFHNKNLQQERTIYELQRQVNLLPHSKEELRELIDEHYDLTYMQKKLEKLNSKVDTFEESHRNLSSMMYKVEEIRLKLESLESQPVSSHLTAKIDHLKEKIETLEQSHHPLKSHVEEHSTRLEKLEKPSFSTSRPTTVRENLIRKIAKSSKEHVKTIIRSLIIKYGQVSALQLREIVVEEQALCSKSSFYRILEELETEEDITVIHEKKEKKYIYGTVKSVKTNY